MKRIELKPTDNRKSFYGKCHVEEDQNKATLFSYGVRIATLDLITKEITKHDDFDYSATTKRHQRAFFNYYGIA